MANFKKRRQKLYQSRAEMGSKRGISGSSGSFQIQNSENPNIVGQRGNPANNDSGINGVGGSSIRSY